MFFSSDRQNRDTTTTKKLLLQTLKPTHTENSPVFLLKTYQY
jgi:hypothetical protein